MAEEFKRVLVLSHNAFSPIQNNGKTLESFFHRWPKDSISQIYLQPDSPDYDFCNNYFRITDYEVLDNVFFGGKIGNELSQDVSDTEYINGMSRSVRKLYLDRRNGSGRTGIGGVIHDLFVARLPILVYLRDLFWNKSEWQSARLSEWIKDFSPDVLFFQGSGNVFGYEIALWICESFKLPLILELTDDYTTSIYRWSIVERIYRYRFRRVLSKAISLSYRVIAISDRMQEEYMDAFGGEYCVLMNSCNSPMTSYKPVVNKHITLLYAGNVSIDRWKVLRKIGLAIDSINKESNGTCVLEIYTPTQMSKKVQERLSRIDSIECNGSLDQEGLALKIGQSDILVHVEAFAKRMRRITRLSISTKIPEYMGSKRCIFAVGPSDVASIMYLRDNRYAEVVGSNSIGAIRRGIIRLVSAPDVRRSYSERAYDAYTRSHCHGISQAKIAEVVDGACLRHAQDD